MQAEIGGDRMRTGPARPTRWIPAEVWQRQGMTAQVLTLPGGNNNVPNATQLCAVRPSGNSHLISLSSLQMLSYQPVRPRNQTSSLKKAKR